MRPPRSETDSAAPKAYSSWQHFNSQCHLVVSDFTRNIYRVNYLKYSPRKVQLTYVVDGIDGQRVTERKEKSLERVVGAESAWVFRHYVPDTMARLEHVVVLESPM
ncbi:uncharacterized protein LOC107269364 [Cephus cinctus]|uniref:Uncharacterized protein LOC107269364 n=1 Tax=Cephus cinctus TaxID=211228 RepID=A0AAJ7C063_CEPCN|nr:uncharacterized protein LOC107269364 [Cephus cinctus]